MNISINLKTYFLHIFDFNFSCWPSRLRMGEPLG